MTHSINMTRSVSANKYFFFGTTILFWEAIAKFQFIKLSRKPQHLSSHVKGSGLTVFSVTILSVGMCGPT